MDLSVLAADRKGDVSDRSAIRNTLKSYTDEKPILFDARKISDGGIGVYSQNLIRTLIKNDIKVALLGDTDKINTFPWRSQVEVLPQNAARYSFEEMFLLARHIPFQRFSVFCFKTCGPSSKGCSHRRR